MSPSSSGDETAVSPRRRVVLITGLSGAGLSTSLKALEDVLYECVDNVRLSLIPALLEETPERRPASLAIALDTRNAEFSVSAIINLKETLSKRNDLDVKLLYLDCSNEELQHRFTSTRRRHPMAVDRPLIDGIESEREKIEVLRDHADLVIDTSDLSIHDLRRVVIENLLPDKAPGMTFFVMSFSYSRGIPREADLVFDVRFLKNPHYVRALKAKTGLDPDVAAYIHTDPDFQPYLERLSALLLPLLPRFQQEGKSYLTIAIGCTGGHHRSVLVAEELASLLAANGSLVTTKHRELLRLPGADFKSFGGSGF